MLVAFFDSRGLIHKEFVPTGQIVNANFYKVVLDRLIERINHVCPDLRESRDWFLQHNNALALNAASICQFLAKKKMFQSFITLLIRRIWLPLIISYSLN